MGERRRGGLGSTGIRQRAAVVCCSAGALLAFAAVSPARADIDDLIDTVLNAATAGVDHAGGAVDAFSPDGFVPGDFDPAAFVPEHFAAPDDIATALAGAADSGTFTDPAGHLDQVLAVGDAQSSAQLGTQLTDAMRQLDESWINTGPAESHSSGFLYGDGDSGAAGAGGHAESGSAAASTDATGPGHSTDGPSPDGQSSGQSGGHSDGNSSGSSSMPKLSLPSFPKGGSGGNGGAGNGGGGNSGGGNNNARTNRSTAKGPGSPSTADPYGP